MAEGIGSASAGATNGAGSQAFTMSSATMESQSFSHNSFESDVKSGERTSSKDEGVFETRSSITGREPADAILQDAKTNGIEKAFENLASGRIGQKEDEHLQDSLERDEPKVEEEKPVLEGEFIIGKQEEYDKVFTEDINDTTELKLKDNDQRIPDEIRNDPLFKEKVGEEVLKAIENGQNLDLEKISQESLKQYNLENEQINGELPPSQEKSLSHLERIVQLEKQIENLKLENQQMKDAIIAILKYLLEKEKDEKEKESLIQILIKLIGKLMVSAADEAGNLLNNENSSLKKNK